jgi:tryptophan halogenase
MQQQNQKEGQQEGQHRPVRRVVIAGGGSAGWMAAAAISKTLGKVLDITLIESDEISTVGVGEATIPTMVTFHKLLEINEQEFMAATNATFKLGISFQNWRNVGEDYIHSFGFTGKDHWTAGFQHFWLKARERKLAGDYGDYCLELKASMEDRFAHLPNDTMNYAYHLDASAYAKYLRKFSEGYGARRMEGKIVKVNLDSGSGHITSLTLDSGAQIEGDLFIDCTGFRSLLLGQAMNVEFEDWSHWLPCDTAIAVQTRSSNDLAPLTRAIAHEAGWQWRIPLQTRVGNGIVYASRYMDEDTARQSLLKTIDGEPTTNPWTIRFKPGQRRQTWSGNCIAVGLASGFLEPVESTSLYMVQRSLIRLLQIFPGTQGIVQSDVDEYNQQTAHEIAHIRDFIILHYKVTNRRDTQFWRDLAAMEVPANLQHRIDLFREAARVFRAPNELFAENSWIQVMLGQGLIPDGRHQVADLMGDEELAGFLKSIKARVDDTVRQLPSHKDYLRKYCPS